MWTRVLVDPVCGDCGRDLEPLLAREDARKSTYAVTKLAQEHLAGRRGRGKAAGACGRSGPQRPETHVTSMRRVTAACAAAHGARHTATAWAAAHDTRHTTATWARAQAPATPLSRVPQHTAAATSLPRAPQHTAPATPRPRAPECMAPRRFTELARQPEGSRRGGHRREPGLVSAG